MQKRLFLLHAFYSPNYNRGDSKFESPRYPARASNGPTLLREYTAAMGCRWSRLQRGSTFGLPIEYLGGVVHFRQCRQDRGR